MGRGGLDRERSRMGVGQVRGFPNRLSRIDPELGLVRLCRGCDEEWPERNEDGSNATEFWYFDRRDRVMGRCKACWSERQKSGRDRRFATRLRAI